MSSIQPLDSALEKNPLRALNWSAMPRTKKVGIAMIGASHLDLSSGLLDSRMVSRTIQNVPNARSPPISGLATHDMTTSWVFSQLISSVSCWTSRTSPTPMIPPIMLWVVETGSPSLVAVVSHIAAAIMAAMNPYIRSLAKSFVTVSKSTTSIPFRTVSVTASPAKKAPQNSKTAAIITACFRVRAFEPTDVPIAFATSFAPMFQAM